ncbi:MAG: HAD hydrolase family protein [Thermaerobacter sp.]|nr:HAD hydrolase family protein [Thermaerobacter sp.]
MSGIRRVLATDIDGTLVGFGGENDLADYLARRSDIGVIYLTGRTRHNAEGLIHRHNLPGPVALVTDTGAEVYWGRELRADDRWAFQQRKDWSPRRVQDALTSVPGVSYAGRSSHWRLAYRVESEDGLSSARTHLIRAGVPARTLWDPADGRLDVIPRGALKGRALRYVLQNLRITAHHCFVAGDAENDSDMLQGRYQGVLVANGSAELTLHLSDRIYRANYPGAQGVLEGLRRWLKDDAARPLASPPGFVS